MRCEGIVRAGDRKGQRCLHQALPGRKHCNRHGGQNRIGPATTNYKHGKYSSLMRDLFGGALDQKRRERFAQALADPDLVNLRKDLALMDVRNVELLEKLSTHESGAAWDRAQRALAAYDSALALGGDLQAPIKALRDAVTKGLGEQPIWEELRENLYLRQKLAREERERLRDAEAAVTREQMTAIMGTIAHIVMSHVSDRMAQTRILLDMKRLSSGEWGVPHREGEPVQNGNGAVAPPPEIQAPQPEQAQP